MTTKELTCQLMLAIITAAIVVTIATFVSCNVTRTVTTEAKHWQHGDTTTTIITKTTESYDATKKTF